MAEWLTEHLPALLVLLPLIGASLVFLVGSAYGKPVAFLTGLALQPFLFGLVLLVQREGAIRYEIGGWGAPLGINLVVDGLAVTMLAMTSVVGLAVTAYAWGYFTDLVRYRYFWSLWLFLWASLNALFMAGDAFNLFVCLELVAISGVTLVGLAGGRVALFAAMRYMLAAMFGAMIYLFGVALLYGAFGVLDLELLGKVIVPDATAQAALALMTVGLILKTALFPLYFWLPAAHSSAPSPVSAALSALVVKASFYIILRLWTDVADMSYLPGIGTLFGILGAGAIFWGSIQALRQKRLKMLVAYSTVAQIGYLFLLFPLVEAGGQAGALAWSGGVFHAVSHALAKAAMFLSAGLVLARFGHDRISDFAGLARSAPLTVMTFGLAGVSMMGLPPSGGFVVKWQLVYASIEVGAWWWAVVVLIGGLLAAGYISRVLVPAFAQRATDVAAPSPKVTRVPHIMQLSALSLAVAALLLGVFAEPILDLMLIELPTALVEATP